MDRSRESPLNPTESRFARGLNESFATHSEPKRTWDAGPAQCSSAEVGADLLLSRSQAAIHPARRMRESIERRWGGRIRVPQPLSVKPLSSKRSAIAPLTSTWRYCQIYHCAFVAD